MSFSLLCQLYSATMIVIFRCSVFLYRPSRLRIFLSMRKLSCLTSEFCERMSWDTVAPRTKEVSSPGEEALGKFSPWDKPTRSAARSSRMCTVFMFAWNSTRQCFKSTIVGMPTTSNWPRGMYLAIRDMCDDCKVSTYTGFSFKSIRIDCDNELIKEPNDHRAIYSMLVSSKQKHNICKSLYENVHLKIRNKVLGVSKKPNALLWSLKILLDGMNTWKHFMLMFPELLTSWGMLKFFYHWKRWRPYT